MPSPSNGAVEAARKIYSKPTHKTAIEFLADGSNWVEVHQFIGQQCPVHGSTWYVTLPTLEGGMTAKRGDWIIRGLKGEVYPCKPDIFAESYSFEPPESSTQVSELRRVLKLANDFIVNGVEYQAGHYEAETVHHEIWEVLEEKGT